MRDGEAHISSRSFFPLDYKQCLLFYRFRARLHGGGGPQVGEVTCLGGVTHLSIQSLILIDRVYMTGGVTILDIIWTDGLPPPKRVTSPT